MRPYEIIMAPYTVWLAPAGTAFPLITAAPGAGWVRIGTNGDANYGTGVTVTHNQTFEEAIPEGANAAVKASRVEEQLMVAFTLWDLSIEQYALALNDATVTTVAAGSGTAGTKSMGLSMGFGVTEHALLARGVSPENDAMVAQYEVPRVYQRGNPAPVYSKRLPSGLAFEFKALADLDAASDTERFGRVVHQHQAPLP